MDARPLVPNTVESAYVSALCALYQDQRMDGINALPNPRGHGVRALMTRLRIERVG